MKQASVERISSVITHPNADRLDLVKILGYQCVTERGLYKDGDAVVYIQPDAVLPLEPWTEDYRKYSPKRIKAVKLRNEWSEGIIVPMDIYKKILFEKGWTSDTFLEVNYECSELLGIKHYEPPIPQDLSAKGFLPYNIEKTDEERWENLTDKLPFGEVVDLFLKVDGQSATYYYKLDEDKFGTCGRTLEFKDDTVNNYTAHIEKYDLKNKIIRFCKDNNISIALRGESYGEGIQGSNNNPHSQITKDISFFSVYLIDEKKYARKGDKFYFINVCKELNLPIVPLVEGDVVLSKELIDKYSLDLKKINDKPFEGVVVQYNNGSFKIINKDYDSKK